jgi:hypothetical protein
VPVALLARGTLAWVAAIGIVLGALPAGALRARGPRDRAAARLGRAGGGRHAAAPAARQEQRCRRSGDLVLTTQPELVPVLERYLPDGVAYLTPLGTPADPSVMDWRDALRRLDAAPPLRVRPGRRIVLVTPVGIRGRAPWGDAVRARTRAWRAALEAQLCRVGATSRPVPTRYRSTIRAEIFSACRPPRA